MSNGFETQLLNNGSIGNNQANSAINPLFSANDSSNSRFSDVFSEQSAASRSAADTGQSLPSERQRSASAEQQASADRAQRADRRDAQAKAQERTDSARERDVDQSSDQNAANAAREPSQRRAQDRADSRTDAASDPSQDAAGDAAAEVAQESSADQSTDPDGRPLAAPGLLAREAILASAQGDTRGAVDQQSKISLMSLSDTPVQRAGTDALAARAPGSGDVQPGPIKSAVQNDQSVLALARGGAGPLNQGLPQDILTEETTAMPRQAVSDALSADKPVLPGLASTRGTPLEALGRAGSASRDPLTALQGGAATAAVDSVETTAQRAMSALETVNETLRAGPATTADAASKLAAASITDGAENLMSKEIGIAMASTTAAQTSTEVLPRAGSDMPAGVSGANSAAAAPAGAPASAPVQGNGGSLATSAGTMPEYTLQRAPQDPEFGQELTARMQTMVRDGVREARLQLNPAELGRLQVTISTDGDQAKVFFVADSSAARDAIEQSLPRLRDMLEQQGMDLAQSDVGQQDFAEAADSGDVAGDDAEAGDTGATQEADATAAVTESVALSGQGGIDTYI